MSTDYIYWTFSSAAQSVSAFVAFLLTGYALVHAIMDSARERDDSLDEVHASLRTIYHSRLTILAVLTGAAIVMSLVVVYINRSDAAVSGWCLAVVAGVDLAAVVGGLWFVVSIIDPRKYQKAAEKALKEETSSVSGSVAPAADFFAAFLHLERLVRDYLRGHDLYIPSRGAPRMSYSFRQMIEALLQNEKIDRWFFDKLLEINKYRNLVFHGHVEEADADMVQSVQSAAKHVEGLQ